MCTFRGKTLDKRMGPSIMRNYFATGRITAELLWDGHNYCGITLRRAELLRNYFATGRTTAELLCDGQNYCGINLRRAELLRNYLRRAELLRNYFATGRFTAELICGWQNYRGNTVVACPPMRNYCGIGRRTAELFCRRASVAILAQGLWWAATICSCQECVPRGPSDPDQYAVKS